MSIKIKNKALKACAEEMNKVMDLEPLIDSELKSSKLRKAIIKEAGDIDLELDSFSDETVETLKLLECYPAEVIQEKEEKPKAKKKASKKNGIGSFAVSLIKDNPELSNKDILNKVKKQFPDGNTKLTCISWYRYRIKKGLL